MSRTTINAKKCDGHGKFNHYWIEGRHMESKDWVELKQYNPKNGVFYCVDLCPICVKKIGLEKGYKILQDIIKKSRL